MSSGVLERPVDAVNPEVLQKRRQEVAAILAEMLSPVRADLRDKYFTEQKTAAIMEEMEDPSSNMEETIGELEAAVDEAEGSEDNKTAIKGVIRSFSYIFAAIASKNQVDEPTYTELTRIIGRLRDILRDGRIDDAEVAQMKVTASSPTLNKMIDRVRNL